MSHRSSGAIWISLYPKIQSLTNRALCSVVEPIMILLTKVIFLTCVIKILEVYSDVKLFVFLPYGDNVRNLGWVLYLMKEFGLYQFVDLSFISGTNSGQKIIEDAF